jgi:TP901 family phage tail tape measure protein
MSTGLLGEVRVRFGADVTSFVSDVKKAETSVQSFSKTTTSISASISGSFKTVEDSGKSMGGLASSVMPLIGSALQSASQYAVKFGEDSIKAASDFQATMNKTTALAGVTEEQAKNASAAILQMAGVVGQTPQQLSEGFYYIASAGFSATDSIKLLSLSAKGAAIGMTSTEVTANALTAAIKAMGLPASDAQKIMDEMVKTVSTGKTEFEDYAKVVGSLSVAAHGAQVSFEGVNAAFAVMTNVSSSSRQAAQDVNALLNTSSKFDVLSKRAGALGIAFDQTKYQSMDLGARMKYLMEITDGDKNKLSGLLGQQNAVRAIMALSVNDFKDFNEALKNIGNSSGATEEAFQKVSAGYQMSLQKMQAAFEVVKVKVGTALLPILTSAVQAVTPLVTGFADLLGSASPLAPIFESVGQWIQFLANQWKQLNLAPAIAAFQQFGGSAEGVQVAVGQFFNFLSQLNVLLIGFANMIISLVAPGLQVFQQIMTGLGTVFGAAVSAIQANLVPAILNLMQAIGPVIAAILQWIATSGILPAVFSALAGAVTVVINILSFLINVIAAVITWFSTTAVGIATFRAILIVLGIAITLIATIILAIVIPAFIAWIAGAVLVGIANIIAFAPIILIILAIVAVVAIVVLVITHWGEIAAWLQGAWGAVGAFFQSLWASIQQIWGGIGQWFQDRFNEAKAGIESAFGNIGQWFTDRFTEAKNGAQTAFGNIGQWFTDRGTEAQAGAATGFAGVQQFFTDMGNNIVQSLLWMYNHNYYFKDLVDTINAWTAATVAWVKQAWMDVSNWLIAAWQFVSNAAITVWSAIAGFFVMIWSVISGAAVTAWSAVSSFFVMIFGVISGAAIAAWSATASFFVSIWNQLSNTAKVVWTSVSNFFTNLWVTISNTVKVYWNIVASSVTQMWLQISSIFSNAWNTYISGPINRFVTSLANTFTNVKNSAVQWGRNVIQGIVDGINGMASQVANAASNIAKQIAANLGFHSPTKEGPGSDSDTWMPNLNKMLVRGLNAGVPQINAAVNQMVQPLAQIGSASNEGIYPQTVTAGAASVYGGDQYITVELDGDPILEAVANKQTRNTRIRTGMRRAA